ncbi:MAG: PEP/pyruvate-binding domain-containing protein [Thermodesulforhabdaceae bacterium]
MKQEEYYTVSFEKADPKRVDKLGAKGAKLVEDFQQLSQELGTFSRVAKVPDGFIITTDVCRAYFANDRVLPDAIWQDIMKALLELEIREKRYFGSAEEAFPLLVAVRGGAPVSLPGAVSTVLNVGLTSEIVRTLIERGEDEAFILSTYANALRMYGEVVLGVPYSEFHQVLEKLNIRDEIDTTETSLLYKLISDYENILRKNQHPKYGREYPQDPLTQLRHSIEAVLDSWMGPTAVAARLSRSPSVPDEIGTAVVIQTMVFGNRNENSLSGVLFTRDHRTGKNSLVIEWAPRIQCDKIVSGRLRREFLKAEDLKSQFPKVYEQLLLVRDWLESQSKRPLDIEFTVEDGKLFILQRRPLRMTFSATMRALMDMVDEGKTTIQAASMIINNALEQPEKILREDFHDYILIGKGEPITDSADAGILAFGTEEALKLADAGVNVILLRRYPYGETDIAVNHPRVRGIIRYDGNATGHEAVSAVAYCKPYLINAVDANGLKPVIVHGDKVELNPESLFAKYLGKKVFVDGESGIVGYTTAESFLEDKRSRKKLYVDWEYVREKFEQEGYRNLSYEELLDIHYQWELELEKYTELEKRLKNEFSVISQEELLLTFARYLEFIPPENRKRILELKGISLKDFDFGPPITYRGKNLRAEVKRILKTLMLCITWRTHWIHELMVEKAKERGDTENDVIRDIFIKNRTMSLVKGFENEGFHVMKVPGFHYLILASNFEYDQDPNRVNLGPGIFNYQEKEILAKHFMSHLEQTNPEIASRLRIIIGEPPLGQGHARIISVGLAIPDDLFALVCRYLRAFIDQCRSGCLIHREEMIPIHDFIELYRLDPFFALYPDFKIKKDSAANCFITFGDCSYGEFEGTVFGEEQYKNLMQKVKEFEWYMKVTGQHFCIRPWSLEVDPFRRHSIITAVGIRFPVEHLTAVLESLKTFLAEKERYRTEPLFRKAFDRVVDSE